MKKLNYFFAATVFALTFTACKKDCPEPPVPVKPVETAPINRAFFVNLPTTITASGSGGYEYGLKFQVTQAGKVTKLISRMPNAGNYRITLWDASVTPKVALGTATITQAAGALTAQAITAVNLVTGKDYFVSVWSNTPWYQIMPVGGGSFSYPVTVGSITIMGYQWISSATGTPQVFPTNVDNSYVAGLADFEFQPN
jgi:hypothetical protein